MNFDPETREFMRREFPPLSPEGEAAAVDAELESAARAKAHDSHFLAMTTTRSEQWGNVFRADFHFKGRPAEYAFRMVCWRTAEGDYRSLACALDDAVPPLSN